MLFMLAFLRQNLTKYVCTQISCLINSFIRILGSLACNIVTFMFLSLVLCCDIYRSTLISIMFPWCMITVHGRKSRALQPGGVETISIGGGGGTALSVDIYIYQGTFS